MLGVCLQWKMQQLCPGFSHSADQWWMLEWETLTCHVLSGLPPSWRVSALIFVPGISHFLVLSHSWVPVHAMT